MCVLFLNAYTDRNDDLKFENPSSDIFQTEPTIFLNLQKICRMTRFFELFNRF